MDVCWWDSVYQGAIRAQLWMLDCSYPEEKKLKMSPLKL
jgi:hypothetical protein